MTRDSNLFYEKRKAGYGNRPIRYPDKELLATCFKITRTNINMFN